MSLIPAHFLARAQVISQVARLRLPVRIGKRAVIIVGSFIYQTFIEYPLCTGFSSGHWGDTDQTDMLPTLQNMFDRKYKKNMSKQTNNNFSQRDKIMK